LGEPSGESSVGNGGRSRELDEWQNGHANNSGECGEGGYLEWELGFVVCHVCPVKEKE